MPKSPEEVIKEAEEQLALYPPVPYRPEWHPYFWLGQLEAARKIQESR